MYKKIINIVVSVSLLFANSFIPAINLYANDMFVDNPTDTNTTDDNDSSDTSDIVSDGENQLNAQCLIYFDVLKNDTCKAYYQDIGSASINDLMSGDESIFLQCLTTNCGSYPAGNVPQEQTYPYIMETVKGCTLDPDKTLMGDELTNTVWLYSNSTDEVNYDLSQVKIIPYKLLQYKCPSYSQDVCISSERVTQSPVLCFKNTISDSLQQEIKNCLDGNVESCESVNSSGGIGNYVFWQYCDQDSDGDGYYESLSPEAQEVCNRSDAADLRCEQDSICTLNAICLDEGDITVGGMENRTCDNLGRFFEEHILNTNCADQTDIYRENPDCVRINSVADALLDTNITVSFFSGEGDRTDDYTEFVIYRKKENFQHQPILAAIFFPFSLDKTKRSYYLFGINITSIARLFGSQIKWEENGLATILDDLYNKTINYCKNGNTATWNNPGELTILTQCDACEEIGDSECDADTRVIQGEITKTACMSEYQFARDSCLASNNCLTNSSGEGSLEGSSGSEGDICEIKHEQDIKYWSWKSGGIIKKKYTRTIVQSAIWTEPFVTNMNIVNYEWIPGPDRYLQWIPTRIDYDMKLHLRQNDILMIYNTNTRPDYESYIETKINTYSDITSCTNPDNSIAPLSIAKNILNSYSPSLAPEIGLHDIAMVLPHAGIYTLELYDNNTYIDTIVKYFPMNDGTNYPMTTTDLLSLNLDYNSFSQTVYDDIVSQIPDFVDEQISDTLSSLINTTTDAILNVLVESNKYQLDNNMHLDYINDLENSDISLLYSLLEEILYEEMLDNGDFTGDSSIYEGDFTNFPSKINAEAIMNFEMVNVINEDTPQTLQDEYAVGRRGSLDYERTQNDFINTIRTRLTNIMIDLDNQRLDKLLYYTNAVYDDFQEVDELVRSYLNKSGTRYSTSTSYGNYNASFKSACGDYQAALNAVDSNYDNTKSDVSDVYFENDLLTIKNNIKSIIDNHMQNITLTYKYFKNKRTGYSDYDNYHYAVTGSYSCSYSSRCWDECAQTVDCNCINECSTNEDGEESCTTVCESCCQAGYIDCTLSTNGSCSTYGIAITNPCEASCTGYVNAHWGSQVNPCGDNECDVGNDWDNSCNGTWYWYNTNDNYGIGGGKTVSGTSSGYFSSWGGYSCDNFSVHPTGTSTTKCTYSKHDQSDHYINTIPVSSLNWSSRAKKLNVPTNAIEIETDSWMGSNQYRDTFDKSPYISGIDNIRYDLAINTANGINIFTNNYIRDIIKNKVIELMKNYLIKYYNNLLKYGYSSVNIDFENFIQEIYGNYYEEYIAEHFTPFNRIIIKDGEVNPNDQYSVNFDITLPGGLYVRNPDSFSVTIVPHNEIRKYRCYTNWETCDVPNNCSQANEQITNFVTDSDGKNVPVQKNISYECPTENSVSTCTNFKIIKECNDYNLSNIYIDYDDVDFSSEFYEGVGRALAFNEAIKIFGGEELRCEAGLFTDFSWLEDPFFWLGAFNALGSQFLGGFNAFKDGMMAWASASWGALNVFSDVSECASVFAGCLNDEGFGVVSLAANMLNPSQTAYTDFADAEFNCATSTGFYSSSTTGIGGCAAWTAEYLGSTAEVTEKLTDNIVAPMANALGMETARLKNVLGSPMTMFVAQIIFNLAFNTFDDCNQCMEEECAQAHEPKTAVPLLKLDNALNTATKYEGPQYGLGEDFVAYNNCFFRNSGCASKFLTSCIRDYKTFCCYNSRITRMLAGQIYQQLGYTYKDDGCSAITLNDLAEIDFSSCTSNTIPSPSMRCINYEELKDFIMTQINWDTQKSFNTNTAINAAINAAKMME